MTWQRAGLAAWCLVCVAGAEPIPPAQFEDLQRLIQPGRREDQWTRIPWRTSLWQARQEAAAQGKPILLWEMNGNPLGCT